MLVSNKGLLIVVNYNSWDFVEKLYFNVKKNIGSEIDFMIIDGYSSHVCPDLFKKELNENQNVEILYNSENFGYYNSVFENYNKLNVNKYKYFVVGNCDIEFVNNDFFEIVSNIIEDYKIIAPSISNNQGVEQNPHRLNKPGFFIKFFWLLFYTNYTISKMISFVFKISFLIKNFFNNKIKSNYLYSDIHQIYSPHGSCIIYSKEVFDYFFSKRFPFFLYAEEDYIASKSLIQGFKIFFFKNLKVRHFENVSTGLIVLKDKYNIQRKAFNNAIRPFWVFIGFSLILYRFSFYA